MAVANIQQGTITTFFTMLGVLALDLVLPRSQKYWTASLAVAGTALALLPLGILAVQGETVSMFDGSYVVDEFALVLKGVFLVAAYVVFGHVLLPVRGVGVSMEPTIQQGDLLFISRLSYRFRQPTRGDIVAVRVAGRSVVDAYCGVGRFAPALGPQRRRHLSSLRAGASFPQRADAP